MSRSKKKRACGPLSRLLLLSALLGIQGCGGHEAVSLEWRWTAGDVLRYRITQTIESRMMGLPGVSTAMEQTLALVFRQAVREVTEGVAAIEMTFESVRVEASQPVPDDTGRTVLRVVSYDSTEPAGDPDPALRPFSRLPGAWFRMRIGPSGKVLEVSGLDEILEQMTGGSEEASGIARAFLETTFNNEAFAKTFEASFGVLPDRPVAPGDSWSRELETEVPLLGKLRIRNTFMLRGYEVVHGLDCATVDLDSTIEVEEVPAGVAAPLGVDMKPAIREARARGELWFAKDEGFLVGLDNQTTMHLDFHMKAAEEEPIETVMGVRLDQKVTVTLLE